MASKQLLSLQTRCSTLYNLRAVLGNLSLKTGRLQTFILSNFRCSSLQLSPPPYVSRHNQSWKGRALLILFLLFLLFVG